jgi:hypothetical protein
VQVVWQRSLPGRDIVAGGAAGAAGVCMVITPDGADGSGASGSGISSGVELKIARPCALLGRFGGVHGLVLISSP